MFTVICIIGGIIVFSPAIIGAILMFSIDTKVYDEDLN